MKNSVNERCITWLEQYHSVNKDSGVLPLIAAITEASTIEFLIKLFSHYLEPKVAQYGAINLYSQLSVWKCELENIVTDHKQAFDTLNKIPVTAKNKKLIMLLNEILNDPKLLLHVQMPSLLHNLCSSPLTELIHYIIFLPKAMPILGAATNQEPLSQQYSACQSLLNNLLSTKKESNPLWMKASSLLRSALLLYKELELIEVSLDDDKSIEEIPKEITEIPDKNSCIVM
jgi:hypothetical protein